jgi:hypothetical protein
VVNDVCSACTWWRYWNMIMWCLIIFFIDIMNSEKSSDIGHECLGQCISGFFSFCITIRNKQNIHAYHQGLKILITYNLYFYNLTLWLFHECSSFHLHTVKTIVEMKLTPLKMNYKIKFLSNFTYNQMTLCLPPLVPVLLFENLWSRIPHWREDC